MSDKKPVIEEILVYVRPLTTSEPFQYNKIYWSDFVHE